jgi:hypothetical protein
MKRQKIQVQQVHLDHPMSWLVGQAFFENELDQARAFAGGQPSTQINRNVDYVGPYSL